MASQSVPDSPPGSKRPADMQDEMSDLIHKAKASRYTAPKLDDDESLDELLEKQLTCSICAELYVDPILVQPCSHSFCGSCAARWLLTSCSCPSCRGKVVDTKPNTTATGLVDILLLRFPEKKRPADEMEELKAIYKPGQKITIFQDDEYISEDEDDENWPEDSRWDPCECCFPDNEHGYICPRPMDGVYDYVDRSSPFMDHVKCASCNRSIPIGWKPYQCDICTDVCCGSMFGCPEKAPGETRGYIASVEDQTFGPSNDGITAPTDRRWRLFNRIEQERLVKYVSGNGMSWEKTVGEQVVRQILIPGNHLLGVQNLCKACASNLFETNLMKWWIWYQENSQIEDERVKCWYGYQCRTQNHNSDHAKRLNHACEPIPPEQRRNNAPSRDSVSIPHPTVANDDAAVSHRTAGTVDSGAQAQMQAGVEVQPEAGAGAGAEAEAEAEE
ncbi:hypothetical protein K440DRAFT_295769 [Wilcoxina mikolae CBS 423.85]|nr:hypothetical protein K440DRAFT_295769 [Wilcoxina mikolae CBS 423.85]